MKYTHSGNRHMVTIGEMTFEVDSNLEERVLRMLEDGGFSGRWRKPDIGLNVNKSNYTPDIELSVQIGEMTHFGIVEIKPDLSFFNDYISRRMRGVAKHYHSDLLLLYTEKDNAWRKIDNKTGELTLFGMPQPGAIPIKRLYNPWSKKATSVYYRKYKTRVTPVKSTIKVGLDISEQLITGKAAPKPKRPYRRRKTTTSTKQSALQAIPNFLEALLIGPFQQKPGRRRKK